MNIRFIKSAEKKKIIEILNEQFGIVDIPYLLIESGKEKMRAFSGSLSKDEISQLSQLINIEGVGGYFAKEENNHIRLSLDATHILQSQCSKQIIQLDQEEAKEWLRGKDIQKTYPPGIYLIQYDSYFLGCTKSNGDTLFNYVPKDRRLKK